jgi:hypothetical protein
VAVSFIGGGKWSAWRKQLACRKSLTNFVTSLCILLNDKEFCLFLIGLNCIFSTLPQSEYLLNNKEFFKLNNCFIIFQYYYLIIKISKFYENLKFLKLFENFII